LQDRQVVIEDGAVGTEGLLACSLEWELFDQVPFVGRGALLEQIGEGGAGIALGGVAVLQEQGKGGVVGLDWGVRGFEGKEAHKVFSSMYAFVGRLRQVDDGKLGPIRETRTA
jgi:hypothetical protein